MTLAKNNVWAFIKSVVLVSVAMTSFCPNIMARDIQQDDVLELKKQGRVKPLDDLLKTVGNSHPKFTLLETALKEQQGQYLYYVNILTNQGVNRVIIINATTAKIIKDEVDN